MKVTKIRIDDAYPLKVRMREALIQPRDLDPLQAKLAGTLKDHGYRDLVGATLSRHLSFEAAFAAMCYVLRASNAYLADRLFGTADDFGPEGNVLAAREMLSGLAMKEAWVGLTAEEVAGFVTATMMDVMRFPSYGARVVETCGMGGDRGVLVNGDARRRKTINGSTLSALTLAALGVKTAKHGSYSNTSAVGSTNAIERLGIVVDIPSVDVQERLASSEPFHYTDAHAWKTVHDLSHLHPRRETINHLIGPMTPPVGPDTRLDKVIGVNEKMRPDVVAKAYELLGRNGTFRVGNIAVVGGMSERLSTEEANGEERLRGRIILDELSPVASVVSFVQAGRYAGTFVLTPANFGAAFPNPLSPFIPNDQEVIHAANLATLAGEEDDRQLVDLLAMNAALPLYLVQDMDEDRELTARGPSPDALKARFRQCRDALTDGRVRAFVDAYVRLTESLAADAAAI